MKWGRIKRINFQLALILSATLIAIALVWPKEQAVTPQPTPTPTPNYVTYEEAVFRLVNEQRLKEGLKPLKKDDRLSEAAHAKAAVLDTYNCLCHTLPDGREPWDFIGAAGYKHEWAGENLAINSWPTVAVDQWMNSEKHRDNLLHPSFEHTGVAVVQASIHTPRDLLIVQMFGSDGRR